MGEKILIVIPVVTGILLAGFGVLIRRLKLYFLIAGYNFASPYEKSHVDSAGLSVLVEKGLVLIGCLTALLGVAEYLFRLNTALCLFTAIVYSGLVLFCAVRMCVMAQRFVS